jgi:hypothetical protein
MNRTKLFVIARLGNLITTAAAIFAILVLAAAPASSATLCDAIGNLVDITKDGRDKGLSKERAIELAEKDTLNSAQVTSIEIKVINSIYDTPELSPDAVRAKICDEVASDMAHDQSHTQRGGDKLLETPAP